VAVFDRRTELGEREFGVSGLLYNSKVLMYDRGGRPEGLWSQMMGGGVSGPAAGKALKTLPTELTAWQDWLARHPETTVLSNRTGHARNYQANPYQKYFSTPNLMFPVRPMDRRLPAKTAVLGIRTDGAARAYVVSAFGPESRTLEQDLGGHKFTLKYDSKANSLRVMKAEEGLQWMYSYWFGCNRPSAIAECVMRLGVMKF